ncbi:MAG TPA: VWA domain-containing protein [Actinomycetota bacterium]|nr:VWA domain-containing protein [Actinomycetota bacterium]
MAVFRYSRWDGTQDPITSDLSVSDLIDALSDDILDGLGPDTALEHMMRRGVQGQFGGVQSLQERIRRARAQQQEAGRLDGWLEQLRDGLDRVLDLERAALAPRDDDDARMRETFLDSLPSSVAGSMSELKDYDFASSDARAAFNGLIEEVRTQMLEAYGDQMAQGLKDMSPEEVAAMRDMLADLNLMLEQRRQGTGPSDEEFARFMAAHGRFFPENPQNLDELLEAMARRMAAMSQLLASLPREKREELLRLSQEIMGDLGLSFEMSRLQDSLRELMPQMPWDEHASVDGERPLGLAESLDAIERLADLDDLECTLKMDGPSSSIEDVDTDKVRRMLGEDSARDVERMKRAERALEEAGIIVRRGGKIEMTPRGVRKLGERALVQVFDKLVADRPGSHDVRTPGGSGEPTGSTRPWRFGDPFRLHVQRTVGNAVMRGASAAHGVRLRPEDFEIEEAETRTSTATVLLLDMSFSMPLRGHWTHAKRMALALHSLISMKYPEDKLSIVGFSDIARELKPQDLVDVDWEPVKGTNMAHAFNLAARLLAKHRGSSKQILLVTDGEPTAHLEDDYVYFQWPPAQRTLEETYKEAMRLAKSNITLNTFMLEDDPGLVGFMDRLAKIVTGRVFTVRNDSLGEFVVKDYVRARGAR